MKIQYLGTAAAEGVPALFCSCDICQKARAAGGRAIRSRSQAIVNGTLLIDFPADTFYHMVNNGIDLLDIGACLITHAHGDHFQPDDFFHPRPGYSKPRDGWGGLDVYGSEDLTESMAPFVGEGLSVRFHPVAPYEPFTAAGLTVTAVPAVHGTAHPYIYLISDGKQNLLYCHDSGPLPEETWDRLSAMGILLDLVSLDCTEGMRPMMHYGTHMCLYLNREFRAEALRRGLADEKTVFVLNHFSHNGVNSFYDDFAPAAAKEDFVTSYDGMTVELPTR